MLHSAYISAVYAVIVLLPHFVEALLSEKENDNSLHKILIVASHTFWWPWNETDGAEAVEYVHQAEKSNYYYNPYKLDEHYVQQVAKYCHTYDSVRKFSYRPNTHRLMELHTHYIYLYGRALFGYDLTFESNNQLLKTAMVRKWNVNKI